MPQSPQSSSTLRPSTEPRVLPGWKSPCTSVSGTPQDATAANRSGSPAEQGLQGRHRVVVQLTGGAGHQVRHGRHERPDPPVRRADLGQLVDPVDPVPLQPDEHAEDAQQHGQRPVPVVLAGHVGQQHPRTLGRDQRRHHGRVQPGQHGALVAEERRHHLEPGRPGRRRQPPDAGEVPRLDLDGRADPVLARGAEPFVGPGQVAGRPARVGRTAAAAGRRAADQLRRPATAPAAAGRRSLDLREVGDRAAGRPLATPAKRPAGARSPRCRTGPGHRPRPARPPATTAPRPRTAAAPRAGDPRGRTAAASPAGAGTAPPRSRPQQPSRRAASQPGTASRPTRSCVIVSRSRTVTAWSSRVSKSTVTQNGVPISSWRR